MNPTQKESDTKEVLERKPYLLIVRGKPGSGKTSALSLLENKYLQNTTFINPDEVSTEKIEEYKRLNTSRQGTDKQWKYRINFKEAIEAIVQGKNVIWDQPWSDLDGISLTLENFLEILKDKVPKVLIVDFYTDDEVAKNRVRERKANGGHGPSEASLEKAVSEHREIQEIKIPENLETSIIGVNSTANSEDVAESIRQFLENNI